MLLWIKLLMLAELAVGTSVTVSVYLILKQYPHYIVHCTSVHSQHIGWY